MMKYYMIACYNYIRYSWLDFPSRTACSAGSIYQAKVGVQASSARRWSGTRAVITVSRSVLISPNAGLSSPWILYSSTSSIHQISSHLPYTIKHTRPYIYLNISSSQHAAMSYVASPEEVQIFEELSSKPKFSQEVIVVQFSTTQEFIKSILPPNFKPTPDPKGTILIGTMESRLCGEFDCALIAIQVEWDGKVGNYMLEMVISNDTPVTWGREVWGETKKTGTVKMYRSGNYRYAHAERYGVRIIEIEGEFGDEKDAGKAEYKNFEIKAYPGSSGRGLHCEPMVNELDVVEHYARQSQGVGRLTLRGNANNPLHTIPIVSISDFAYSSGLAEYTVVKEHPLGATGEYLPYLVGRHYDDLRSFKVGNQWGKLAEKTPEVQNHTAYYNSPGFKV